MVMLLGFIPAGALAENYKVCKASNPQEKTTYGRNDGVKILITECTEHIWRYTASETKGMHKVACGLCSMFSEEKHDFSLSGGAKAEAVIESSDAKTYYETLEKAAAAVSQNDTLKLCFDADCEDGYCDYCNEKFAASVANADGAAYKYYTDINEAVKAQLESGNSYTVRHSRLEHMRPMLVKFPLSRSFGICKATALPHPARTPEQKFFGALGLRVQKEQIFCKKRQKRS